MNIASRGLSIVTTSHEPAFAGGVQTIEPPETPDPTSPWTLVASHFNEKQQTLVCIWTRINNQPGEKS